MVNTSRDFKHLGASPPDPRRDQSNENGTDDSRQPTRPKPGGFKNDPDDPNNPNEVIERERESVREMENPRKGRSGNSD